VRQSIHPLVRKSHGHSATKPTVTQPLISLAATQFATHPQRKPFSQGSLHTSTQLSWPGSLQSFGRRWASQTVGILGRVYFVALVCKRTIPAELSAGFSGCNYVGHERSIGQRDIALLVSARSLSWEGHSCVTH
jgi:hypothetical protein